jgi:flagellar hook-length control protein FliK
VPPADQAAAKVLNQIAPPLHHTPQTPPPVAAQLLHHSATARTGGVDVLLQPEELGHVKFQIQQHGDTLRIVLSAERPETVELLRRNADQLLQEFRQSGFAQASLSFGQWGDQQRPPAPPLGNFDLAEIEQDDPPLPPRPQPNTPNLAAGGGLNLRL